MKTVVLRRAWLPGCRMVEPGDIIDYDGPAGSAFRPLADDESAQAAAQAAAEGAEQLERKANQAAGASLTPPRRGGRGVGKGDRRETGPAATDGDDA